MPEPSPHVERSAWGRLEVNGATFKDAKIWPGGARAWDWGETGTRHRPGIQPADVEEIVEHGARVVVLSQGVLGALRVMPETLTYLRERGVTVHRLRTDPAIALYEELRGKGPVGALIHSTC